MSDTIQKPTPGQKTQQQPAQMWSYGGGITGPYAPAGCDIAGVNVVWPWWGSLLTGTYGTYRAMMRFYTIAYAISQVVGPLIGSEWDVDADEGASQQAVDWVKDNIIFHRDCIIVHALRAIPFGNAPFEVVWNGDFTIREFVPLSQDYTQFMRATTGRREFTGLQNGEAHLAPAECLYIKNDSDLMGAEPGDDYGRSRLENIRDTAWANALETLRRLSELEDRISGVLPWMIVPSGTAGNGKTFAENAAALLPSICHPRSQGFVLESPGIGEVDAGTDPGTFKQLSTTVGTLDMRDRAAGQAQMLAKLKYLDEKMGEGIYRGARTLFATQGGTKADSGQHTANAEPDEEAIDNMIARQINEQPVAVGLTLKFGPDILKTVRGIKPKPLVDSEREAAIGIVQQLLTGPQTAPAAMELTDADKLWDKAGVPRTGKMADILARKQAEAAKIAQNGPPALSNATTGMNGNGNGNGKVRVDPVLAKRLRNLTK